MKVVKQKQHKPRIIWYGPSGIGKTTFGAGAEEPIFICTEDGAGNLPVDKYDFGDERVVAKDWDEVLEAIREVAKGDNKYKTIVVDTWSGGVKLASSKICKDQFGGKWTDKKYGFLAWGGLQGWGAVAEEIRAAIPLLDKCRNNGMTVVLLCQEYITGMKDAEQGEYYRFIGDHSKQSWIVVEEWADIIGHAQHKFDVLYGTEEKKGRALASKKRIATFLGSPAHAAKCRTGFELPDTITLPEDPSKTFSVFMDELSHDDKTLEKVKGLWGLLSTDEVKSTLKWLGTTKLEKAPNSKLKELLTKLEAKEKKNAS